MYSPLGLVIFVAVERTFVCFTKGHDHLFQILFVAAGYEQGPVSRSPCALLKLDDLTNACICCMH